MKDLASELLLKVLRTPAVAEQVRKSLVNRDLSVTIDGKEYQILRKQATDDELDKLKVRNYDLTQALKSIIEAKKIPGNLEAVSRAITEAERLL